MIPPLKEKGAELSQKAKDKGRSFSTVECRAEHMVIIVVGGIPAMFLVTEGKNQHTLFPMKVNLSKWAWAYEEGFKGQEIFELFGEEIFTLTSETKILEYLKLD